MSSSILFYTPPDQRDYLGQLILAVTHGTWSHVAIARNYEPASSDLPLEVDEAIEAVPPAIRKLQNEAARRAIMGASASYHVRTTPDGEQIAWNWLEGQLGKGYSFGTLVADLLANTLGLRSIVKLPGTQVCSSLAAMYLRLSGDPIIPPSLDVDLLSPADLGERLLKLRTPVRRHGG